MNRRKFILGLISTVVIIKAGSVMAFDSPKNTAEFPFKLTDEQWRQRLSSEQYRVLREEGTERSGTSPLNHEKRDGIYHCAACGHPLYYSAAKYESGTGWPSFWQPASDDSIQMSIDRKLFYSRNEIHCANCGSHLGHVFKDGPQPTGLRYCMNGVALSFSAAKE